MKKSRKSNGPNKYPLKKAKLSESNPYLPSNKDSNNLSTYHDNYSFTIQADKSKRRAKIQKKALKFNSPGKFINIAESKRNFENIQNNKLQKLANDPRRHFKDAETKASSTKPSAAATRKLSEESMELFWWDKVYKNSSKKELSIKNLEMEETNKASYEAYIDQRRTKKEKKTRKKRENETDTRSNFFGVITPPEK
eukprot:snap_masked-scaffold_18-processed-gene-6.47-mRNA-1 protein AED:1.00 eAED:1.00 QI:0/0/0/0/1/1/2/0/195